MENTISSAGLLFLHIHGYITDDEISMQTVNSYSCNGDGFINEVLNSCTQEVYDDELHIFAILGDKQKSDKINAIIGEGIRNNFDNLLYGLPIEKKSPKLDRASNTFFEAVQTAICREIYYPRPIIADFDELSLRGLWASASPDDNYEEFVKALVCIWLENEMPVIRGKQVMNNSFISRYFEGRKMVSYLPPNEFLPGRIVFEGGRMMPLDQNLSLATETAGPYDLDVFTSSSVQSMLLNPCYAYERLYQPMGLCEEWHKVFLYLCAISENEWTNENFSELYTTFFTILDNICFSEPTPSIVSKEQYIQVMIQHIERFRSFLRGEDEPVISKDLHQTMNSRYVYLPYIWDFFSISEHYSELSCDNFTIMVEAALDSKDTYEKGILWEQVTRCFLEQIDGWRITANRIRAGAQEIDFSVANVSLQNDLWEMGAYVLVECKNWSKHVGLREIRNIAHISTMKGNKTALLFAANGISRDAAIEIERLAGEHLYILCFTAKDLLTVKNSVDCKNMLLRKWHEIKNFSEPWLI